jgi:glycosyltransferase involved in cell wall biosynthesis
VLVKLAFIVQRYGREILGGSETLARQLAERLSRRHDITVLTTTAKDYITWKSEYEPGEEKQRGVRLIRFPVEGERNIDEFNKFSEEIYQGTPTREQELEWLDRQGPVCPELIAHLEKEHESFDLLIFFTYLYYPTFYGLRVAPEKSVLVPTAHDEPPLKLSIFKEMFQLPGSFLFNTEAEEQLVLERFPVHKKMRETVGMGMELLDQPDPSIFRDRHNVSSKYFLYAGRIDGGKGLEELFRFFSFYKEENPASGNLELMLIGKLGMKLPDDKSIRYAGFVDEAEKLSAMAGAIAVLQPSKMESLSIVTLEAFAVGTPVVANAASRVLIDHCRKANAGFYYNDFEEFEGIFNLLLSDRNLGRSLGKNGQRYIKENYGWQNVLNLYELALRASGRPLKEPKDARRRDRLESRDGAANRGRERADAREPVAPEAARSEKTDSPPEREPDEVAEAFVAAVSESADPDATLSETEALETETPRVDEDTGSSEGGVETRTSEPVAEASTESDGEGPPAEPVVEKVSEDVAHLPSFFQAAIPARKPTPVVRTAPTPPTPPTENEPKPEPPPPPAPPAPPADGGLPMFFRPRPTALSKSVDSPKPEPAEEEPGKEEDRSEASEAEVHGEDQHDEPVESDRPVE